MSSGYEDHNLVNHNWPVISVDHAGLWHSKWTFEFRSQPDTEIDLERMGREFSTELSKTVKVVTDHLNEMFDVVLESDGIHLFVHTTTESHLIGSEYMSAIIELFQLVEQNFGHIELIQSQPREIWPPWWKPQW